MMSHFLPLMSRFRSVQHSASDRNRDMLSVTSTAAAAATTAAERRA